LGNQALIAVSRSEQSPASQVAIHLGDKAITSDEQVLDGLPLPHPVRDALAARVRAWVDQPSPRMLMQALRPDLTSAGVERRVAAEIQRRAVLLWHHTYEQSGFTGREETARNRAMAETTMQKSDGELVAVLVDMERPEILVKGAGHKYFARYPSGKPAPRWRYVYKYPAKRHLVADDELRAGVKVKVEHLGKEGHFSVVRHDKDKGLVHLRHDESGKDAHVKLTDLKRMVEAYHRKRGTHRGQEPTAQSYPQPKPELERKKAPALAVVNLRDVHVWGNVAGFARTRAEAEAVAASYREPGQEFGIVEQPGGFLLLSRQARKGDLSKIEGDKTTVFYRSSKGIQRAESEYILSEAENIIPSHKPDTFAVDPRYPEGVQERVYHSDPGEQRKVQRIADEMDPALLVNSNSDGVNGPPVVTQDGIVLGGNGRTMGIIRAYSTNPRTAALYKQYLTAKAADFGFSSHEVEAFKKPVLVRRVKVDTADTKNARMWARVLNDSLTQGMDPRTEEVALATNYVGPSLISIVSEDLADDDTISKYLTSERSRAFVRACFESGIFDEFNANKYVNMEAGAPNRGLLNDEGGKRIQRVLVASVVPDSRLLRRMPKSMLEALSGSVPHIFRAKASGWDLTESFRTAVDAYLDAKDMGADSAAGYLRQVASAAMGGDALIKVQADPVAQKLLGVVFKTGTKATPRAFREFANRAARAKKIADNAGHGSHLSLFGAEPTETPETPERGLEVAVGLSTEGRAQREQEQAQTVQTEATGAGMNTEQWGAYREWAPLYAKWQASQRPGKRGRKVAEPKKPDILLGVRPGDAEGNARAHEAYLRRQGGGGAMQEGAA